MVGKLPFLSDDFHFAIASVAARSAQMEHHLELAIAHSLRHKEHTARFVLKNLSADKVVKLYQALLLDEFPGQVDAINSMISFIEDLRRQRNEIVHWLWGKSETEDAAYNATMRPFREEQRKPKTAKEIQLVAEGMLLCVRYMVNWMNVHDQKNGTLLQKLALQVPPQNLASALAQGLQESEPQPQLPQDSSQQ